MTAKKNILVITELYPNTTNTFLGTFVVRQLCHLGASYSITVITTHAIPLARLFQTRQPRKRKDGTLRVISIRYYPAWLSIARLLRVVNDRQAAAINKHITAKKILTISKTLHRRYHFDLVHGHEIYIGDEAIPVGEALGIPSIFTLHGLFEYHLQGFGHEVMKLVLQNLRRVKNMIAVSHIAANTYLHQGVRPKKLQIIPNGITWQTTPAPNARVAAFSREQPTLLTVGFMVKEKRMDQVIRVLDALRKKNSKAVLVIVGRGEMAHDLRQLVKKLNLTEQVLFLGEVSPQHLPNIYAAVDIVVHPSVVDSFSMVCLEAMSFGKPVICTSNIGITEYTTSGKDIVVVPPDDQTALEQAVENLATDHVRRQSIGKAAQQTAKNFTAEKVAAQISSFYEQL